MRTEFHTGENDGSGPLYPPLDPFCSGWLAAGHGHEVHHEQSGNPDGLPALVLHGGPGSGSNPQHRRFFDPRRYRIVQFDQRGTGRSRPSGSTEHNHTALLLEDIEALREHLGIGRWLVFGGSWGASLALAYSARHRQSCLGVLLRGMFLTGRADMDWFFRDAGALAPEAWQRLASLAPKRHRRNLLYWYGRVLTGTDETRALLAAHEWSQWECSLMSGGRPADETPPPDGEVAARLVRKFRIQAHYMRRECWLGEAALLRAASLLHGVPTLLVHGRRDLICRPANAWRVHRTLAGSRLVWVDAAGHDPLHPAMAAALVAATDGFARHGDFRGGDAQ